MTSVNIHMHSDFLLLGAYKLVIHREDFFRMHNVSARILEEIRDQRLVNRATMPFSAGIYHNSLIRA